MPLDHYATLGNSGLRVSPFCLGAMTFGEDWGWGSGVKESKAILSSCEESLRRLQTDYIDLYWMHCWDRHTPIAETLRALDDLVASGKVRYVGFSDTPAWKVAQAQTTALLRGWAPLCALQIEYSLLERTVEGELIPMARELGLGVTPWSPLAGGALSGKYTRANAGKVKASRGAWVESSLDDHGYAVIDVLIRVARAAKTTPARAALAWVQARPGVASTIIGARTCGQLDDNLAALDVCLSPEQAMALDEASKPALDFPAEFLARAGVFAHGGCTINGETSPVNPMTPKTAGERY